MRTVTVPAGRRPPLVPRRVLALAGDDRLVEQIRRGSEAAFEVAFERHSAPILSFCRHMLGSREEAEDAVQHTFAAAYRSLLDDGRDIALKPWLYAIARNRCLSVLRARREQPSEELEPQTAGLQEQVQQRAELQDLLRDLRDLPGEQREALLLAELGDLSHTEIAGVLDCEVARVKALVFRARSGLMQRREARELPCLEVREQLANLRGGSLRRSELKHHLRECDGCRAFREEVRRQRQLIGLVLPVLPSAGLKGGVLGAIGFGGGSAGGGAAIAGSVGSSVVAKLAVAGVIVGGGTVVGTAALEKDGADRPQAAPPAAQPASSAATPERRTTAQTQRERRSARRGAGERRRAGGGAWERRGGRRGSARGDDQLNAAPVGRPKPPKGGNAKGHTKPPAAVKKPKKPKRVKAKRPPPKAPPAAKPPKPQRPPAAIPPPAPTDDVSKPRRQRDEGIEALED